MATPVGAEFLLDDDRECLARLGKSYEVQRVSMADDKFELRIILHDYDLPAKYAPQKTNLMVRQFPGYPETGMDMFWTNPTVFMAGTETRPLNADVYEGNPGMEWQRWSRHMNGWRGGIDCLETFLAAVRKELQG